MASVAVPPVDRRSAERKFYTRMALLLVAVVLLGFGPSFYLRGIVPPYPRPNPTLSYWVVLHGLLFTSWMAIFVVQTQLIAAWRHKIHMQLGTASMLLAIALLPTMYLVAVWQVARANSPPFTTPLDWTILPLAVIPAFGFLVWEAWRRRREAQWHKRLMLGAAIVVVFGPAISRLPLAPPVFAGFAGQLLLGLVLYAPMFVWDRRSIGHTHPATWTAFAAGAAAAIIPIVLIGTGSWAPIAKHLPGVGV